MMKKKYSPKIKDFSDLQLEKEKIRMDIHIVGEEIEKQAKEMLSFNKMSNKKTLLGMGVFIAKAFVANKVSKRIKLLKK